MGEAWAEFKSYFWQFLCVGALAIAAVQTYRLDEAKVQASEVAVATATKQREDAQYLAAAVEKNRTAEQNLQQQQDQNEKETNAAQEQFNSQSDALLVRVRLAEQRAANIRASLSKADSSAQSAPAASGDGGELLGTYGEEDVSEAKRADTYRLQLVACHRSYEDAQAALKALGAGQ